MGLNVINGDLSISGRLTPKTFDCPIDSVRGPAIPSTEQIPATKLQHQHRAMYADLSGTTTASVTKPLFVARFAGTLVDFAAGNVGVCTGAATITVDLKKNNVTVLSATIVLDNANTARVVEAATLNPAAVNYVAGDLFELVATAAAGGGALGTGFYAAATLNENSQ